MTNATLYVTLEPCVMCVGAIVQATGWKPYDASKLGHLGYGSPNVITNVQMEELAASGTIARPSDGKPARRIAFIQCAGSRDQEHLPYCAAVCCRVTLKQALWARELDDQAEAYVLYKDIRSPGQYEDYYRRAQEDPGIFFTKGEVLTVQEAGDGNLVVDVENTLIDKHIQIDREAFTRALQRASILSNEKYKGVRLEAAGGMVKIIAHNPQHEEAVEELEAELNFDQLAIGFNVTYLLDALMAIDTDTVLMELKDANSSCLISAERGGADRHVVMPLKL